MENYLIKKDDFIFGNILASGYVYNNQPSIKSKTRLANGKIKIVYAQYDELTISIKFGQLNGEIIKEYSNKFTDGIYEYWDVDNREYKTAYFVVTKGSKTMITSKHDEMYKDYDIVLEKSNEVI